MKILFVGGTGIISSACSERVLERGHELFVLNRGQSVRPLPEGARHLQGDIHDEASVRRALGRLEFDAVVNWVNFVPEQVERDLQLFRGRTGQYVFISSASAYETPPSRLPVREETPLSNPFWAYSRNKIACEERLLRAWQEEGFPMTIVRPSHTYDRTLLPFTAGWTVVDRMLKGRPVIVHGDGTSIWTLTHHRDFAKGFMGVLGRQEALGEAYHITSDEWLSWNQIFDTVAAAFGTRAVKLHIPSDFIAGLDPEWGENLLGDKSHSMIFDNSKIRTLVPGFRAEIPFASGVEDVAAWYGAHPERQVVNPRWESSIERILGAWGRAAEH